MSEPGRVALDGAVAAVARSSAPSPSRIGVGSSGQAALRQTRPDTAGTGNAGGQPDRRQGQGAASSFVPAASATAFLAQDLAQIQPATAAFSRQAAAAYGRSAASVPAQSGGSQAGVDVISPAPVLASGRAIDLTV